MNIILSLKKSNIHGSPKLELHEYAEHSTNAQIALEWNYVPKKRDGFNHKRKSAFINLTGDLVVNLNLPQSDRAVDNFLKTIHDLLYVRLQADELEEPLTNLSITEEDFEPTSDNDAKKMVERNIVLRQGQPIFRKDLLVAYNRKCAISGCTVVEALEAAHIEPYNGVGTNKTKNGLLLRADIHTLWDLNLIGINPKTLKIAISKDIAGKPYTDFTGKKLSLPRSKELRPSSEALNLRWINFIELNKGKSFFDLKLN